MDLEYANQTLSKRDHSAGKPLLSRFAPIIAITAACWLVFVFNNLIGDGHLSRYGIIPRQLSSLPGIIWAPFLHGSFQHLAANTLPLLILGGIICARSKTEFALITAGGIIVSRTDVCSESSKAKSTATARSRSITATGYFSSRMELKWSSAERPRLMLLNGVKNCTAAAT